VGLTTLPCKKKIVEKPPRNSARFCGGGQGPSWAVEPRKEEEMYILIYFTKTMCLDKKKLQIQAPTIRQNSLTKLVTYRTVQQTQGDFYLLYK
jgi:hypothetical protein